MTYRVKRRGILVLIAAVLAAAVVYMERYEYNRIQRDGAYMEHLCFVMSDSMSEQKIFCFTDETEQTSYLFLPSYAKAEDVKISFNGADTVVFSGDGKETALKDGGKIGALQYDKKYEMYFLRQKGRAPCRAGFCHRALRRSARRFSRDGQRVDEQSGRG